MRVLFVCSGNICRSPMAAEYLRHRAAREGLVHIVVESAGLLDIEGAPASIHAQTVLREAGLDLGRHRSRGFSADEARTTDLIVGMTLDHLDALHRLVRDGRPRLHLIRAFERGPVPMGGAPELDDPVLGTLDDFRACFATIRTCVDHLVLHLKHLP